MDVTDNVIGNINIPEIFGKVKRHFSQTVDKHFFCCYDNDNGNDNMSTAPRRINIKHVAKEAGVSTQTISRVINQRPDVAPDTRQRILEIIQRLGYQRSELARSLIQRRSYTLGVVTAGLQFIGPSRTLNGIATKAEELGYALLLKELPRFNTQNIQPLIQFLLAQQVDGILWAVSEQNNPEWTDQDLVELPVPIFFITMQDRPSMSTVSIDNYLGGKLATQHLLAQGRQHIGHISGPLDWWEARRRKQAWQDTLAEAGIAPQDHHSVQGNWSSESGEAAFQRLLQSYPEMDAVFVANDQMALAVLQSIHRLGLRIPQDIAVVGFDNITESANFWPALTTVFQDHHELGCVAVRELVSQVESVHKNESFKQNTILLSPELIVRESSVVPQ